jgi:hypothetical protein
MGVSGQRHAPAALYPRERTPGTRYPAPEPVWTQRLEEKSFRLCKGWKLDSLIAQPVDRHYTDWATRLTDLYMDISNSEQLTASVSSLDNGSNTKMSDGMLCRVVWYKLAEWLIVLMMEAVSTYETSVDSYQTAWCNSHEDSNLPPIRCCESLMSHVSDVYSSTRRYNPE